MDTAAETTAAWGRDKASSTHVTEIQGGTQCHGVTVPRQNTTSPRGSLVWR